MLTTTSRRLNPTGLSTCSMLSRVWKMPWHRATLRILTAMQRLVVHVQPWRIRWTRTLLSGSSGSNGICAAHILSNHGETNSIGPIVVDQSLTSPTPFVTVCIRYKSFLSNGYLTVMHYIIQLVPNGVLVVHFVYTPLPLLLAYRPLLC